LRKERALIVGRTYEKIDDRLGEWLQSQPVFFVATAPLSGDGHINLSPKGVDRLRVLGDHTVGYLDHTGSGIETVAHIQENGRIVIMCCAFEGPPRIVRLHGQGRVVRPDDDEFGHLIAQFSGSAPLGTRAIVAIDITRISDSCGYGVPLMQFVSDRDTMDHWATKKGEGGLAEYQAKNNSTSIDGLAGL
jgi:hypothetical protein